MKSSIYLLREKNITIPLLFGSRDLVQALNITGCPSYILITPERHVDFIQGSSEEVKNALATIFSK